MSLANIMSSRVVSVHMDDSLESLQTLFAETGFHHLVVVYRNQLQGIISDRDLLKATSPFANTVNERFRDRATLEKKAHQIMTRNVLTLSPSDSIVKAISLFNDNKISCIPIVDDHRCPIGMVSWRDVMRYMEARVNAKKG
ncbi:CBS domain-containing protein [Alteromonas sp. 1_MG-2023]|uniref:CBS domain-containing protein n=1 Tax=Alteromonas sp. 1_MG-2023 TaxID=3062669 RepID=UPI0026E17681|nr:CBS domain-containing protein [Alteromonas sp. 1_MG-2023]MDO6568896.1 CBS domain-containing protein [Alteromonas sp. 1_MG-2023]